MAGVPTLVERTNGSIPRPVGPHMSGMPTSPRTPQRNPVSTYSSPGSGLRSEEELVVIELGARHVSVGLAGESRPKCTLGFSKEECRRVGDFRKWLPKPSTSPALSLPPAAWGLENELWRMDIKDLDVGQVEDKLERTLREAFSKYLLQDSKARRLVLVIPSVLAYPILACTLSTLFRNFQPPGIVLFPAPTMTVLASGQRSGVVVDIGWHETIVTIIYEFRQIKCARTIRAMKLVTLGMARMIDQISKGLSVSLDIPDGTSDMIQFDFEYAEEITIRCAFCRQKQLRDDSDKCGKTTVNDEDEQTVIELPSGNSQLVASTLRFADFSLPVEYTLFGLSLSLQSLDDHEHTIPTLIYEILSSLDPDVRALCISNIIFTGGGSQLPGLKTRLLDELSSLIESNGWDPAWRQMARRRMAQRRSNLSKPHHPGPQTRDIQDEDIELGSDASGLSENGQHSKAAAYEQPQEDHVYQKIKGSALLNNDGPSKGRIRSIESLGAWAGASMATNLKIKGVVEVEKDVYQQHGLSGAQKEHEINTSSRSRPSMGVNTNRSGVLDNSTWALGIWAS